MAALPTNWPVQRRALAIFAVFLLCATLLMGMTWLIHQRAEDGMREVLDREFRSRSTGTVAAMELAVVQGGDPGDVSKVLEHQLHEGLLDSAFVLAKDGMVRASADPAAIGSLAPLLAVNPERWQAVLHGASKADENVHIMGEAFHRIYLPVRDGSGLWGVAILESHDRSAEGLARFHWIFWIAEALAAATAAFLALGMAWALRRIARAEMTTLRQEQLAAAGQLAATVAHEVRNPLQCILAAVQLLPRAPPEERGILIADIESEVRRADSQLDGFLDLTREMPLRLERCSLGPLLSSTIEMVRPRAIKAGIELLLELPDAPVLMDVDQRRLRQAIINLLLNALQAMEGAGKTGSIRACLMCERRTATISIADTGPGIPPQFRDSAFDPFTTTRKEGTGLGLPLARQTAERHGGTLTLGDRPGGGTVAILTLPLPESV